jgi:hypothetical protein
MWGALSDERTGLSFIITAGTRQRSHSWVWVPPYFTVSDSRLSQPGGPGPSIYVGGPVMPPDTGFPFHRLLRLAGLRWRYSDPPSRRIVKLLVDVIWTRRGPHREVFLLLRVFRSRRNVLTELFPNNGRYTVACLHSCYLVKGPGNELWSIR